MCFSEGTEVTTAEVVENVLAVNPFNSSVMGSQPSEDYLLAIKAS